MQSEASQCNAYKASMPSSHSKKTIEKEWMKKQAKVMKVAKPPGKKTQKHYLLNSVIILSLWFFGQRSDFFFFLLLISYFSNFIGPQRL